MLTLRLGTQDDLQVNPDYVSRLLEALKRHPGACDEVWFATYYGFPKLESHEKFAGKIAAIAEQFRAAGIRVSLQLSNSIGHGAYMSSEDCTGLLYPGSPAEHMVGESGQVADTCWCWNGEHFRDYTAQEVAIYARLIQPHSFWIDDDLRASNHAPIDFGCFCPDCLNRFNTCYGSHYDRESLIAAIHADLTWRQRYTEFIREHMADFTKVLCEAIHKEAPDCRVCLQNGVNNGYIGHGLEHILNAMEEVTGQIPGYRAGGGTYSDHDPNEVIQKGDSLSYQHWFLPERITELRPEIENLPDVAYGKSPAGTCLETSYYLALGATAMSYAMICNENEPMEWHEKEFEAFRRHRSYWEALSEASVGTHQGGLQVVLPTQAYLADREGLFGYTELHYAEASPMRYLGIPLAYSHETEGVFLLHGSNAAALNHEEITHLLSHPLILDAEALHILAERGYDCGGDAVPTAKSVNLEIWSDHPINGREIGRKWPTRFLPANDWEIRSVGTPFEPISHYYHRDGTSEVVRDGVNAAILHPAAGGTWAVFGKDLWDRTKSECKRRQLLNTIAFLGGTPLCAELCTPAQAVLLPRLAHDGTVVSCSVLNCCVGDSGPLTLKIFSPGRRRSVRFLSQYQEAQVLPCEDAEDGRVSVTIPNLRAWSVGTVFFD